MVCETTNKLLVIDKGDNIIMSQNSKASDSLHSLSHTKWNCRYHIVFAPKCRRCVFYSGRRQQIGQIIGDLCRWKGVTLVEGEACPDHIHILVEIPSKMSVLWIYGVSKRQIIADDI